MAELIQNSMLIATILIVVSILILWLFIKSAVKSGVKEAILESYKTISQIEKDPVKKEKLLKTPQQEMEEELQGWR